MSQINPLDNSDILTRGDSAAQQQALKYFQALVEDENGWKTCTEAIVNQQVQSEEHYFLCLQVIEHYLKYRYAVGKKEDQDVIRQLMVHWIRQITEDGGKALKTFLRNKMSQVFALIFIVDFPGRWPTFFDEVFFGNLATVTSTADTSGRGDMLVDFYLRTLLAIDGEVADREIQRTKETNYWETDDKIGSMVLNVIGSYISWIDISLVANDSFVPLIVASLGKDGTREAGCDCICSILSKGMDPSSKLELVEAMHTLLTNTGYYGHLNAPSTSGGAGDSADVEDVTSVAELTNCMGTVLIECWNKLVKTGDATDLKNRILASVENKLGHMLICMRYEDMDVSNSVLDFAHQYILLLKTLPSLTEQQNAYVNEMLRVVIQKYRFPEDYNHDKEEEDEALFMEYRKDIKNILTNISILNKDMVMTATEEMVKVVLENMNQMSFIDINMALSILYFLGETFPANQGALFQSSTDPNAQRLKTMLLKVLSSGVNKQSQHPCVSLEYFEIVVRYDKLISGQQELIPDIVQSFLDERGLHHSTGRVRSRVAYLFSRFVKSQKSTMQNYVGEILSRLGDLLAINPDNHPLMSAQDQLFIYEATGSLIVVANFTPEQKQQYMQQLVGSLVEKFKEGLAVLRTLNANSKDAIIGEKRKMMIEFLNNIMAYASRTTKAFSNQVSMKNCLCSDLFLQLMGTFVESVSVEGGSLLNGLRQYLHRMVICLESEILPHLPIVLRRFLSAAPDLKALQDFILLVQQIVTKFNETGVREISNEMSLLWTSVITVLNDPTLDLADEGVARDLNYLKRNYLQLILQILQHKCLSNIVAAGDELLSKILLSVREIAGGSPVIDPMSQRQAFSVAHKMIQAVTATNSKETNDRWLRPWLTEGMLPTAVGVPLDAAFDLGDAQHLHTVIEIATLYIKANKYFAEESGALMSSIFQSSLPGLPDNILQDILLNIRSITDPKSLQKYLKNLYENLRKMRSTTS